MKINWQWVVIVALMVGGALGALALGDSVLAASLGGLAGGLLLEAGAVGRKQ